MPYFLPGGMVELPLTLTEDYTLFHMLKDYSTALWQQQIATILESHGLITALAHPDYLVEDKALAVYRSLLEMIDRLRTEQDVWVALPGDVDRWWRQRSAMRLVSTAEGWRIEGQGSHRARVAYACLKDGRLTYKSVDDNPTHASRIRVTQRAW
jgi:hypothetical protein